MQYNKQFLKQKLLLQLSEHYTVILIHSILLSSNLLPSLLSSSLLSLCMNLFLSLLLSLFVNLSISLSLNLLQSLLLSLFMNLFLSLLLSLRSERNSRSCLHQNSHCQLRPDLPFSYNLVLLIMLLTAAEASPDL